MTQPYAILAQKLYPDNAQQQDVFTAAFVSSYKGTAQYGGLRRTEQAILNANRGCNRSSMEMPDTAGSLAGFAIGLIDHQLRALVYDTDAYKLFAQFIANLSSVSRVMAPHLKTRLDRELHRNAKLTDENKQAIVALEKRVFGRAA